VHGHQVAAGSRGDARCAADQGLALGAVKRPSRGSRGSAVAVPTLEQEAARDLVRSREDCRGVSRPMVSV